MRISTVVLVCTGWNVHQDHDDHGNICRASPQPGERKVLSRKGRLWVGTKTVGAPPPTQPTQPTQPEQPGGFF